MISFPYQKDSRGELFPIVDISLSYGSKTLAVSALVDSGASVSVFKPKVAEFLKVPIVKGKETYLGGVGGRIKGYTHKLKVEVAGEKFSCPIVFSYEYTVSFNLLGREGFFKNFVIVFNEKKKEVELRQLLV